MEQMELLVSWIRTAVDGLSHDGFDLKSWGVLFAVLVLVLIWSIVRALNRLTRQLSSAVMELLEIRSILKKFEQDAEPWKGRPPSNDPKGKDILNLSIVERDER